MAEAGQIDVQHQPSVFLKGDDPLLARPPDEHVGLVQMAVRDGSDGTGELG